MNGGLTRLPKRPRSGSLLRRDGPHRRVGVNLTEGRHQIIQASGIPSDWLGAQRQLLFGWAPGLLRSIAEQLGDPAVKGPEMHQQVGHVPARTRRDRPPEIAFGRLGEHATFAVKCQNLIVVPVEHKARLSLAPSCSSPDQESSVGGKLHGFWYAFGEYDGYNLWEAPDNVAIAAVAIAIGGGGALSKFETTVLLSVEETMEALRRVETLGYRPPGA